MIKFPPAGTLLSIVLIPVSILGLGFVLLGLFFVTLPDVLEMKGCLTTSMYQVDLCPGGPKYAAYSEISPVVIDAVVASEDAAFFSHSGFDWYEIRMSLTRNLREQSYRRGGSTITQQLAKNVFLNKQKSILRKLREAYLTFEIERQFSKKEILERYLNVVEFGPDFFGVKAAALRYFNKSPANLHLLEATYLAFLLPNPVGYSKNSAAGSLSPFARKTMTTILGRLVAFKRISPEAHAKALEHLNDFPWANLSQRDFSTETSDLSKASTEAPPTVSDSEIERVIEDEFRKNQSESEPTTSPDTILEPDDENSQESEEPL